MNNLKENSIAFLSFVVSIGVPIIFILWFSGPFQFDLGKEVTLSVPQWLQPEAGEEKDYYIRPGDNVTVTNHGDESAVIAICYSALKKCEHKTFWAYENLTPGKSVTFGADSRTYNGMYVSLSQRDIE